MDPTIVAQYVVSCLMLAMIYGLLALGFTLFFGVLDIIHFSHGDVFMVGAFAALASYTMTGALGITSPWLHLLVMIVVASLVLSMIGVATVKWLIVPLKSAPTLNVLLATMMLGTALREIVRLFFPNGASPHSFPTLLPAGALRIGGFPLRFDTALMLLAGVAIIVAVHQLITRTRLGLAIQAVSQDEETAKTMGINYTFIVMVTFALGSTLAAVAAIISGLYYNEISFSMGLMLGAIGFSAAIIGGLGSFYGALLGGLIIAALQTVGAVALPFSSAYKDVFMFAVVIVLMTWRPTGLISERSSERV